MTTPLNSWPTSMVSQIFSAAALRASCCTARMEPTTRLRHRLILRDAGLARRDEYAHAERGRYDAAAVLFDNGALDNSVLFLRRLDGLPALELVNALLGQGDGAFAIVNADYNSFDLVAGLVLLLDLVGRVVRQLAKRDIRRMLNAQVDLDICSGDLDNCTGDLISCI